MHLRFTIRDLFWLVLVAAMATGWWIDHRRFAPYLNLPPELIISLGQELQSQQQQPPNQTTQAYAQKNP